MQWWDVYVQAPEYMGDAVSAYLQDLGSSAVVIHDQAILAPRQGACIETLTTGFAWTVLQGAFQQQESFLPHIAALQQFLHTYIQHSPSPMWRLYCQPLQETDYLTQWQHFFQPLRIGERLLIRPSWDTAPRLPGVACLTLDPGLAFGTGTHPTTRLCLQLLVQLLPQSQQENVLDVGCGSGILSLAALKLGVDIAVAVDIDAQAVAATQHNALLNDLQDRIHCFQGSLNVVAERFTWIMANIYLGPLIEMLPLLVRRLAPGGVLILSGILASQEETLRERVTTVGLAVRQRALDEGWVALAVQHKDDVPPTVAYL